MLLEGGDLLCLATVQPSGSHRHPTLFAGSQNGRVHAFSVDQGRLLGSWDAHDDAVCCAVAVGSGALVTASWDCAVKVRRLFCNTHHLMSCFIPDASSPPEDMGPVGGQMSVGERAVPADWRAA